MPESNNPTLAGREAPTVSALMMMVAIYGKCMAAEAWPAASHQLDAIRAYAERLARSPGADGWCGCAGCSTPTDCRKHGCGVTRGLWNNVAPPPGAAEGAADQPNAAAGVDSSSTDQPKGGA